MRGRESDGWADNSNEPRDHRRPHRARLYLQPLRGLTDPSGFNAPSFVVQVSWRGEYQGKSEGGWVVHRGPMELLASSASKDPQWDLPERFRRWQYRFPTFEAALAAARAVVDHVKVNGRTWTQWQEKKGKGER